jgi:hypothetical protein
MDVRELTTKKHVRPAAMHSSTAKHTGMNTFSGNKHQMQMTKMLHMFACSVSIARNMQFFVPYSWLPIRRLTIKQYQSLPDAVANENYLPTLKNKWR